MLNLLLVTDVEHISKSGHKGLWLLSFRFDEFGFRVDEEDGPEQNSKKLLGIPFVEDPQHR